MSIIHSSRTTGYCLPNPNNHDDAICPCGCEGAVESHNEWIWGPFVCCRCLCDSDSNYPGPCSMCRPSYDRSDPILHTDGSRTDSEASSACRPTQDQLALMDDLRSALLELASTFEDPPAFTPALARYRALRAATAAATSDGRDMTRECMCMGDRWATWAVRVDAALLKTGENSRLYPARIVFLCLRDEVSRGDI